MSKHWVVVVCGVVLGLAAACGGSAPTALRGTPQEIVRAAVDRTFAVRSAHVMVSVGADLAGTGSVDFGAQSGSFTFVRTGASAHLDDQFSVVAAGPSVWVRAAGPAGGVPGTTTAQPWLEGSPQAVTNASYARVNPLGTVLVRPGLGTDVAFLRGAVHVTAYGGEEVEGVNTYRYTFDVDLAVAIAGSPPAQRPALEAAAAAIGPVVWPADVWLDSHGRVRRLQMAENPFTHTTTTKPNLFVTEDGNYLALTNIVFDQFGTRAAIRPPTQDQAVEASYK